MTTIKLPATIWLPILADLPRLFQDTDRPYLYVDSSGQDMTPFGWTKLQEIDLSFELDDSLVSAPAPLQPPIAEAGAPAEAAIFDPVASDPQGVDMAPDEGTAL